MKEILLFVIGILAVYRVSRMVAQEEGPFSVFLHWRNFLKKGGKDGWIVRGFHCPLCISFWLGFLFAPIVGVPVTDWRYVAIALALSGGAVVLYKGFDNGR
jgi:hypothetical protein